MSSEEPRVRRKLPLIKLCIAGALVCGVALVALRGAHGRELASQGKALAHQGMDYIRSAGPWVFFGATALLPAFGAPLSLFTISAGDAFGSQMSIPGVIAAASLAIAVNLALTYWLARYALRPILSGLVERYGYKVPRVTPQTALSIALVLRLTPGPPFFLQSYILGLAEMPFRTYMIVSWLCILPWTIALVILGQGLLNGNFKLVLYGVGAIVAASVVVHALRRRLATRNR